MKYIHHKDYLLRYNPKTRTAIVYKIVRHLNFLDVPTEEELQSVLRETEK